MKKFPEYQYEEGGSLFNWYEDTFNYNLRHNWLERVKKNLWESSIDLSKQITFVSPSANKGKYEFELSNVYENSQFIVTDYRVPFDHNNSVGNFTYISKNNNALNIKNYLNKLGIDNVEYIWDMKGALWYNYKIKELEDFLKAYHAVLKPNGAIIIDAYYVSYFKMFLNSNRKPKKRTSYIENSTYSKIHKSLSEISYFMNNFTIELVGEGDSRIAIMRVKEAKC